MPDRDPVDDDARPFEGAVIAVAALGAIFALAVATDALISLLLHG